ncbi:MAG: hypothetical protein C0602_05785 [Denitrovibrio sp.]|nr:MAG: hypothetical protein C0602_05785 [Denitrovibrio sp.]
MKHINQNLNFAKMSNFDLTDSTKREIANVTDEWPTSSGKTQYQRFLYGKDLTYRQAVLAKCAECCGGYVDGRGDCKATKCPLYPLMPYRDKD